MQPNAVLKRRKSESRWFVLASRAPWVFTGTTPPKIGVLVRSCFSILYFVKQSQCIEFFFGCRFYCTFGRWVFQGRVSITRPLKGSAICRKFDPQKSDLQKIWPFNDSPNLRNRPTNRESNEKIFLRICEVRDFWVSIFISRRPNRRILIRFRVGCCFSQSAVGFGFYTRPAVACTQALGAPSTCWESCCELCLSLARCRHCPNLSTDMLPFSVH